MPADRRPPHRDDETGTPAVSELNDRALIVEQVAYYRERAPEYDQLFDAARADPAVDTGYRQVRAFLDSVESRGRVLELACGTGQWTPALLTPAVTELVAVDATPEMLAIHAERVRDVRVRRVQADLFRWEPDGRFDLVVIAFWLSHVPLGRFDAFWGMVGRALAPGGVVAIADSGPGEHAQEDWLRRSGDTPLVRRTLSTGFTHRVIKVLHEPSELASRLAALGWDAEISLLGGVFLAGTARRA
ncbi:MAG: class I SAM-dependent methyltransferase [Euzebyales bacterium]|nr:class I SAM-dependent methyltransferase [Euzebyales bacterium]